MLGDTKYLTNKFSEEITMGNDGNELLPESSMGLTFLALEVPNRLSASGMKNKDSLQETSGSPDSINHGVSACRYNTFSM